MSDIAGSANVQQLHRLQVPAQSQTRLDKFLVGALPDFSRARLQSLIRAGNVRVNGKAIEKTGELLEGGEQVELIVPPTAPSKLIAEAIPLDIIFENKDVVVVNKPAGLVVHPAAGHATGTLVHAVLAHAPEIEGVGGEFRPGLVHRLDKDTSGLIVLAKNDLAQRFLQEQFQNRSTRKTYLALLDGHPATSSGRVDAPIGRDPRERKRMAVVPAAKGRQALSEYRVLESFPEHSLVEVDLHTGRTHQIRVHMAFIGCPVVGDRVYGHRRPSLALRRLFLHASRLQVSLPDMEAPSNFEAPLPQDLQDALDELRTTARA